jgi:hypothetical protein
LSSAAVPFVEVVVDKPHHAGFSGCRASANGNVTVPLSIALSATAALQQLLHLLEHLVLSRSKGGPLNATSITAGTEAKTPLGRLEAAAGAD